MTGIPVAQGTRGVEIIRPMGAE